MDRRFFLALLLTALVVVATPFIFPSTRARAPQTVAPGDSVTAPAASAANTTPTAARPAPQVGAVPTIGADTTGADTTRAGVRAPLVVDTTTVVAGGNEYRFLNVGAAPVSVRVQGYDDLSGGTRRPDVELVRAGERLLRYRFVVGPGDTIALDTVPMRVERTPDEVRFTGNTARGAVAVSYRFERGDSAHLATVSGRIENAPAGSRLLVDLPRGMNSAEVDTLDDLRHLSFSYKRANRDVESFGFAKLDTALAEVDTGAITWVAARNKYFLTAVLAADEAAPFRSVRMRGGPQVAKKIVLDAQATASMPLDQGGFAFQLYTGPQKYERLNAIGRDLVNVNPYGGWFAGIVQPFATIVMKVLLWLKRTTMLSYGWVLVIFGVLIRVLIWPLNQSAMRSSIRMQRLQPEMQAIQAKYARDPEKLREAMMRLYADHGMSPFSPVMGCLPMLIPMPVLFALYHVFQNTVEFRGVPFMWLPDLTLKDPFFITPIFMGLSMLLLSWIGLRGAPQTPQTKVMSYAMPAMMTVLFLNFPSGLNLYYAVQNVVALPQQWLLSRERAKAGIGAPVLGKVKA